MDFWQLLANSPALYIACAGLFGLLVGSFLNVVIHRLPLMLEQRWAAECAELHGAPPPQKQPFNLLTPPSHCPKCKRPIRPLENIPLLSWIMLRGRCRGCGTNIPWIYPFTELASCLVSIAVVAHFGWTAQSIAALGLSWALLVLAIIDLQTYLLPDSITLPGLWVGLLAALLPIFTPLPDAVIGAAAGYLSLWSIYWLFRLVTGKEGMGYGDFKLLAMLGAWLGWQLLPVIIFCSAAVGAVIGITLQLSGRLERGHPLPYGPFLAIAGWISMLWGAEIVTTYKQFAGF